MIGRRWLLLAAAAGLAMARGAEVPLDLGTGWELLVDRHAISRLDSAGLRLHEPQRAEVAMRFDRPWEGDCTGFFTVIKDGARYRMYYVGCPLIDDDDDADSYPCYAESRDGIVWTKPNLGLCAFQGSKNNNILILPNLVEPYATDFAPFLDERPGVPADERFKAVGGGMPGRPHGTKAGLWALASGDGIHWRKWRADPILLPHAILGNDGHDDFDMQNCAFWSQSEHCYVLYYRIATDAPPGTPQAGAKGCRNIARTTSPDFVNWTEPQRMGYGPTPLEQLYTIATFPYYRAPGLYLAFPMRFVHGRRFLNNEELDALNITPRYYHKGVGVLTLIANEVSDSVFMTSRGGNAYDRTFMEAFFRPGPDHGNWVARDGMSARGIVPTGPTEISVYHQMHYAQPSACLVRYRLRMDGFASVNAPYAGGEMTTRCLRVTGRELAINFSTSAAGSMQVEVQDAEGNPIPGFSLVESPSMTGDSIEYPVRWARGYDLASLRGRTVRFRFAMKDADLYAFRFRD